MLTEEYTRAELFDLWRTFRESPDAVRMLSDFADCDKGRAGMLHISFWRRFYREFSGPDFRQDAATFPQAKHGPHDWEW